MWLKQNRVTNPQSELKTPIPLLVVDTLSRKKF